MSQPEHVLVVGAGIGGLRTVEQLRTAGFQGRISLVGDEPHAPYDRPPLSKQVLTGEWAPERTTLRSVERPRRAGGAHPPRHAGGGAAHRARWSSPTGRRCTRTRSSSPPGWRRARLPGQPAEVHTLRTLDDALALRSALEQASSLLVIGGGFIGAEVASSARTRGLAVTVLEALPVPSARALGEELGALAGRLMREAGVELRTGAQIDGFVGDSRGRRTRRRSGWRWRTGASVAADVAVVGIGGVPRLGWMDASGGGAGRRRGLLLRADRAGGRAARCVGGGRRRGVAGPHPRRPAPPRALDQRGRPGRHRGARHPRRAAPAAAGAVLLVRPVRPEDPAPRQAGARRHAAAAARRRARGRRRAGHGGRACSPTGGWRRSRASARRASSRATAPLLQEGADGAAALELAGTLSAR